MSLSPSERPPSAQPESQGEILLRPARAEDIPAIAAIYAHYVRTSLATFEEIAPDAAELERRRAEIERQGFPYLVAERGGRVLGYAYASHYRTRSAYRHTVEDSVYIDPSALRQGIGRLLLAALIERATELGYRQMIAVIGDTANAGSIGVHAALGFREIGRLPAVGYKLGRWVDSVLMQRPLGPGNSAPPTRS